jgi:3-oxoacid CoA-transferase subunit A
MSRVFVKGDCHGRFSFLPYFCESYQTTVEDTLIILGDAGINFYLNKTDRKLKKEISLCPITLFCVHGNHEQRPALISTYKAVYYEKYGCWCWYEEEFPNILFPFNGPAAFNGKKFLIIGGAYSVDKEYRLTYKLPWFESELLSDVEKEEILTLIERENSFDYILTHTAPLKYEPTYLFLDFIDQTKVDKSMEEFLQVVCENVNFTNWWFGHYHSDRDFENGFRIFLNDIVEIK